MPDGGDGETGVLAALAADFGDRARPGPLPGQVLVLPRDGEEVRLLARTAARHSLPLVAQGAGTATGEATREDAVLVRFDLMASVRLPGPDDPWVEAEPGATLLSLENNLKARGRGLAVYPTSAPRATVGGWLAGDGIGVGSFEYGRLPENVLSADVVLAGGGRKTVRGEELRKVLPGGLAINARLRTRHARDTPFALRFGDAADLAPAASDLLAGEAPLWHLAFLNAAMSRLRGLGEHPLLFGAHPQERAAPVGEALEALATEHGGLLLPPPEAYRAWGQRFYPVAPSRPTQPAQRRVTHLPELAGALEAEEMGRERPTQGTVGRSGEVLLLTLRPVGPAG